MLNTLDDVFWTLPFSSKKQTQIIRQENDITDEEWEKLHAQTPFEIQNKIAGAAGTTVLAANVAADATNIATKMQRGFNIQTYTANFTIEDLELLLLEELMLHLIHVIKPQILQLRHRYLYQ